MADGLKALERTALCRALSAALMVGTMLATAHLGATSVLAQSSQPQSGTISIPPGPLTPALNRLAARSGLQILYDANLAAGRQTNGVSGATTPNQALSALLAGTGVTFRYTGTNTVTIVDASATGGGATVEGAIALDTIDVSGGRAEQAAADLPYQTPGSSAYISAEEIERVPPKSAGDIFREVPGVMSGSNHNGTAIDVNIRGLQGMSRVKVMVDGTQQESSSYRGYAGPDNRSYVDPDFLSGVAVDKGPNAGPYGAGAIGGVVNMKTIGADDLIAPGKIYGGRIRTSIGGNTFDPKVGAAPVADEGDFLSSESWRGSAAAAVKNDNLEIVAAFARRQQGNYFVGKKHGALTYPWTYWNGWQWETQNLAYSPIKPGQEVQNTSEDTTSALLKTVMRFDDGQSLELGLISYESKYGLVFPSDLGFNPPKQYKFSDVTSRRVYGRYKWNPSDNDLVNLTLNLWRTVLHSRDPYWEVDGDRALNDTRTWGVDGWNTSIIATKLGRLQLNYGGEYSSTDLVRSTTYPPIVDYIDVSGGREIGGIFGRGTLDLTEWLTVEAGLRADAFRSSGMSRNRQTYRPGELEASAVSPSAGVTVKPLEGLQLFVKYTEGWRPPSMTETFGSGNGGNVVPNLDLRPEQSKGWEFGANLLRNGIFSNGDRLRAKVAYFDNDYTDYLARGYAPSGQPMFINLPGAKLSGIEGTISYDAGFVFVDANVNYFDKVEYCYESLGGGWGISGCSGHPYPGDWRGGYIQPQYSGSATIGTRLFDQRLTLGARVNFFGESAVKMPPWNGTDLPVVWAAEQIYDVFANYKLSDATSVNFSIENLEDRFYISPLAVAQIPSPGRTATLTFELKF